MKNKTVSFALAFAVVLSGCGTREYPKAPTERDQNQPQSPDRQPDPDVFAQNQPRIAPRVVRTGYLWRAMDWIGVPDQNIAYLRCRLADRAHVDHFKAFGTSILGGGIIGLVIRNSGSWFFGRPIEPGPGHWFWNRLEQATQSGGQGFVRGALFGGACETILAGGNLLPFSGILGQNFTSLSAAAAMGGLASMATVPFVHRHLTAKAVAAEKAEEESKVATAAAASGGGGEGTEGETETTEAAEPARPWIGTQELERGVRYNVVPGIVILGVGGGVGWVIYDWMQDTGDEAHEPACGPMQQAN